MTSNVILENRQARHLYHIEDSFEAGLVLEGWEVKAILGGRANFNGGGAYVRLLTGEAWLESMTITPQVETNQGLLVSRVPGRARKLLLKRQELDKLSKKVIERGYTLVPLAVTRGRKLKLQIGLAKGRKQADKRQALKERDLGRAAEREMRA